MLPPDQHPWRILILSHHPMFGDGMRSLLAGQNRAAVEIVQRMDSAHEAMATLQTLRPDVVIVDCDDETINRDEFLARFVESEQPLRVVLVSLKETGPVVLYDRRTLSVAQVDDWLSEIIPGEASQPATRPTPKGAEPL